MYHVIAVWSCDQRSDHVTLNMESPRIPHPLLWGRHKWISGPTCARGVIGKYLTNYDLSRHCGTGELQKYDDLSRHSGTQEVNVQFYNITSNFMRWAWSIVLLYGFQKWQPLWQTCSVDNNHTIWQIILYTSSNNKLSRLWTIDFL